MRELSLFLFQNSELIPLILLSVLSIGMITLLFRHLPEFKTKKKESRTTAVAFIRPTRKYQPFTKNEVRNVLYVIVVYAVISLHMLGSSSFFTTTWQNTANGPQEIILECQDETRFSAIHMIAMEGDNNSLPSGYMFGNQNMVISGSNDLKQWDEICVSEGGSYGSAKIHEGEWDYRYIKIMSMNATDTLSEFALSDEERTSFLKLSVKEDSASSSQYPATYLIDEQDKMVLWPTYYDEVYFDEVYHVRNAVEIAEGQDMYPSVHPLFGTNLIALSIRLFGNNPLAWRLPGALAGIAIIPVFYLIIRLLFDTPLLSLFGSILCAFDFMHITASRIATLEPFSILFILIMFLFMIRYLYTNFFDTSFRKTLLTLLWCGIFMGIGIAAKWTACYSAVGLAILFFTNVWLRIREYRYAKDLLIRNAYSQQEEADLKEIYYTYPKYLLITIAFCFLFFIFIPIMIYWASYLPDRIWKNDTWSFMNVWNQNLYMYNYHSTLDVTHPYQSTWVQWVFDLRPIWYHYSMDEEGLRHTIACFSNPLLCWSGGAAMIYTAVQWFRKKERCAWIILIGFLTAIGPWIFAVNRCVFAYHFYPSSFFFMAAIVYAARDLLKYKNTRKWLIIFTVVYILIFVIYLPVTCGFATRSIHIKALEVLKGWYFG